MTDEKLTPAEAGRALADAYLDFAGHVEEFNPKTARVMRRMAEHFQEILHEQLPPWMRLQEVRRHTGWSLEDLQDWCREHEDTDLVRRAPHWEILRAAIGRELKPRTVDLGDVIDMDDIKGTARRLARIE